MKSIQLTDEVMARRTLHFKDMQPYKRQHANSSGIAPEALERLAAHCVYPIMVPQDYTGRGAQAPIKGAPGLILSLTESPPGDGAALHIHEQTIENFFCLSGRFRIIWGDEGEQSIELGPLDFCSIPPGVVRGFKNISNETGRLLAIIHVQSASQADRIAFTPHMGQEIASDFGSTTVEALTKIGIHFDAGLDTSMGPEEVLVKT